MAIYHATPLDRTFHALGDVSRRHILATLGRDGARSAGELVDLFQTSQPTVSKHLRVLEEAGLVSRRVEGRKHFFSLESQALKAAGGWIERHVALWDNSLEQLGQYLDGHADGHVDREGADD